MPRDCPPGKEISLRTGKCINVCSPGSQRSPSTGRCRKVYCDPGYERSPVSGRCVKTCSPDKFRHPTTGRCRQKTARSKKARTKRIPNVVKDSPQFRAAEEIKDEIKSSQQLNCIQRSKLKALPHQLEIVDKLEVSRGVVAVHSIGSGKTLTAVISSQCFLDKNPESTVIVISPKTLIANFQKEMASYGIKSNDPRYEFYSFQSFQRKRDHCEICRGNFLIVDEAHELRTPMKEAVNDGCNRSLCVFNGARCAKKVLLLTATPIVNSKSDVVNLVDIVKGRRSYTEKQVLKMSDAKFSRYIEGVFSKYDASRIMYPESRIHEVELVMSDDFLHEYRDIEQGEIERLGRYGLSNPKAFYTGMRTALLKIEDSAKVLFTLTKIAEVTEDGGKVVVYSNFKQAGVEQVAQLLDNENIPYGIITGEIAPKERRRIITDYNTGKLRILLITKAAGMGIDLKETRALIVMDVPWNNALLQQAIGRAVRYESHINLPKELQYVDIYILYSVKPDPEEDPSSVDSYLRGVIVAKRLLEFEVANYF